MKTTKKLASALSLGLMLMSVQPITYAAEASESTQNAIESTEQTNESQEVIELTLEDVKKRALENSANLVMMEVQIAQLADQERKTNWDQRDLEDDIDDLKDARDRMRSVGMVRSLGAYDDRLEQLEDAIKELENGQVVTELTREKAKVALNYQMTAQYTQLLTMKEQIEFLTANVKQLERDLEVVQLRNELDMASDYDVELAKRKLETNQKQLTDLQNTYKVEMAKLALDIEVPLDKEIVLKPVSIEELTSVSQPEEISSFIENSYSMKEKKENLKLYQYYKETADTSYDERQSEFDIQKTKQEMNQLKKDLSKQIETMYKDVNQAHIDVLDAQRKLEDAQEDYHINGIKYQYGLLSEYDFNRSKLAIKEAEFNLEKAINEYFMAKEAIEYMKQGLINKSVQ